MAEYPPIRFRDPTTGSILTAHPTGKFRIEFSEPQTPEQIGEQVRGADPLFRGPTLAADYRFEGIAMPSVEQVQELAASSAVITRVLPSYSIEGHEFFPQPDSLVIRAITDKEAGTLASDLTREVQGFLGSDEFGLAGPEEIFPGLFAYEVTGNPAEPGGVLLALQVANDVEEVGVVSIDAAHSAGRKETATCKAYPIDYTERYDAAPTDSQPLSRAAAVAVLDSFFELDHPALNFQRPSGAETRGIETVNLLKCSVTAHGTSCAGVIGAFGPDAVAAAAAGAIPGVELVPIRVFEEGLGTYAEKALALGIRAAVDTGVGVVSISLATPHLLGDTVGTAISYAEKAGVVLIAGSGNNEGQNGNEAVSEADLPIEYPAQYGKVLAVGAATLSIGTSPALQRSVNAPAIGGIGHWSSKYGLPDNEGTFRRGVSVVAQGIKVATTDLLHQPDPIDPIDPSNPGRFWTGFAATSASGPVVAGLAARLRAAFGLSAEEVRARIECLAFQPKDFTAKQSFEIKGYGYKNYSDELGFGWIARSVENLECGPTDEGATSMDAPKESAEETTPAPTKTGPVNNEACTSVECAGLPKRGYKDLVAECAQPLSVFLKALADRRCCTMLYDFLDEPYLTARAAGVPYAAAIWLGTGDWESVNQALMGENGLMTQNVADIYAVLGPIWVKAR